MKKFKLTIRTMLWLGFAGLLIFILLKAIVPSGKISYINNFSETSYFISGLLPQERALAPQCIGSWFEKECSQKMIGEPVYFNLKPPRNFQKATIGLKYKLAASGGAEAPSIVELGILKDKLLKRYELKPVYNALLEKLISEWSMVSEERAVLLQREEKYSSIAEFLDNLPAFGEIAVYNYDLNMDYIINGYSPATEKRVLHQSLRGAYRFYTYIKDETLDFDFSFLDINQDSIHDKATIIVYYQDEPIYSREADGDSNDTDDGKVTELDNLQITIPNLPEGAYLISIQANDDMITDRITTAQSKMAFDGRIWIAGELAEAENLLTNSEIVQFNTTNPASLQAVTAGNRILNLDQTFKQFSITVEGEPAEIKLEKSDIILAGNKLFAFSKEEFFDPTTKKADGYLDPNKSGVNYILARYSSPKVFDGWKYSEMEFDLASAYAEDREYGLIISAPGLKAEDDINDWLEIRSITINLVGKTFQEKMKEFLISNF